jgi:hypothetical protein
VKQLFVATHRYIILQKREKIDTSLIDQNLNVLRFYESIKRGLFCGYILTEGVIVTQLSSNAEIAV